MVELKVIRDENFLLKAKMKMELRRFEENFFNLPPEERSTEQLFDYKMVVNSFNNIRISEKQAKKLFSLDNILETSHKTMRMMRAWGIKPEVNAVIKRVASIA